MLDLCNMTVQIIGYINCIVPKPVSGANTNYYIF